MVTHANNWQDKNNEIKIIEIKIYLIIYVMYNKSVVINIIKL
jgi:hypothetical protein